MPGVAHGEVELERAVVVGRRRLDASATLALAR